MGAMLHVHLPHLGVNIHGTSQPSRPTQAARPMPQPSFLKQLLSCIVPYTCVPIQHPRAVPSQHAPGSANSPVFS